jgi:hypothetical protein
MPMSNLQSAHQGYATCKAGSRCLIPRTPPSAFAPSKQHQYTEEGPFRLPQCNQPTKPYMLCRQISNIVLDYRTNETAASNNIANDMRMGNLRTDASTIFIGRIGYELRLQPFCCGCGLGIFIFDAREYAREMVDMAAGEADERFFLCWDEKVSQLQAHLVVGGNDEAYRLPRTSSCNLSSDQEEPHRAASDPATQLQQHAQSLPRRSPPA